VKKQSITTVHDLHKGEPPVNEAFLLGADKPIETKLTGLIETLERRLSPRELRQVQEIGHSIGRVGVTLRDACLLARVEKPILDEMVGRIPDVQVYFDLKRTEYKYKLMEIVSDQALSNKDVKTAAQLLELQFAEEFNPSVKKEMAKLNRNAEEDVMEMAILLVRRGAAQSVPINPQAGDPQADEDDTKFKEVREILK